MQRAERFLEHWKRSDDPEKDVAWRWRLIGDLIRESAGYGSIVCWTFNVRVAGFDTVDGYVFEDESVFLVGMVFDSVLEVSTSLIGLAKAGLTLVGVDPRKFRQADIFVSVWESIVATYSPSDPLATIFQHLIDAGNRVSRNKSAKIPTWTFPDGSTLTCDVKGPVRKFILTTS